MTKGSFAIAGHVVNTLAVRSIPFAYAGRTMEVRSISIDGRGLWEDAAPFDAAGDWITPSICPECFFSSNGGLPSCGSSGISVRRHGDVIYWDLVEPDNVQRSFRGEPYNHTWWFSRDSYERELGGSAAELPDFTAEEIQAILRRGRIFPWQMGLYIIPDCEDDSQGRRLLEAVGLVVESDGLTFSATPAHFSTIRIGIETDGVPECILELGLVADQCAVRFVENPTFPLWLTSEEAQRRMRSYAT